jgi:hypothetical protein
MDFVAVEAQRLDETYDWDIPAPWPACAFERGADSRAKANIRLKRALSSAWQERPTDRASIERWYVSNWGGVRANSDTTLAAYAASSDEQLLQRAVRGVASYLSTSGDNNGVTITSTSLKGNILASAGANGNINVDVGKISSVSASYAATNPGMSSIGLRNATGAGALAHEARHERDFQRLWNGNGPPDKAAEMRTELNAYRTQVGVWEGTGFNTALWHPGMTAQQEDQQISGSAQKSTDFWCAHGGSCGP